MRDIILEGDARMVLNQIPNNHCDMILTSPPYWGLRDYGMEEQIGLEKDYNDYISKLCDIFDDCKRVLRPDGTVWVNLGDTYGGTGSKGEHKDPKYPKGRNAHIKSITAKINPKCLLSIPHRFAIEMINRGWILRNTIIWYKPNCMPSSASDRFTVDFEYLFFFSMHKQYYFKQQFDRTISGIYDRNRMDRGRVEYEGKRSEGGFKPVAVAGDPELRNKRAVWKIPPGYYNGAHFAVFPLELCETPIKAGCRPGGIVLDIFMGSGSTGLAARKLNRHYIGIELNPEYIKIAEERLKGWKQQKPLEKWLSV